MTARIVCFLSLILLQLCCNQSPGHNHDHDDGPDPISVTIFRPKLELFMEYPPLVAGQSAKFLAHFSVLVTGEPIKAGEFEFEARKGNSQPVIAKLTAPKRDGLYIPEITFQSAGEYEAKILVSGPQVTDEIPLGKLIVYADEKAMRTAIAAEPESPEPPNAVPFLMEQQWKIGMLLDTVSERPFVERLLCAGEIVAPIDRSAIISTPTTGRLMAPPGEKLPRPGTPIKAGQLLAIVEPATPIMNETATYALELRTRAVDIQRDINDALAHIEFAKREYERLKGLQEAGSSSSREMFEVERNMALAQSQYNAAIAMKAKYDQAANQLNIFLEAANKPSADSKSDDPLRVRLTAPISGQIVAAANVDGEQLDQHDEIFRIVDLDRAWVTSRVSEFDLARIPSTPNAVVVPNAYPDKRIDVLASGGHLVYFGSVIDPASRTIPLTFEIPNSDGTLRVGMLADVLVETKRTEKAVAIPEQSIVMDNSNPVAFVLLTGELFQKRELTLGIRDAGFVEVRSGLIVGEKVVSRGAYAVKLSALSGSSFGPGHVH